MQKTACLPHQCPSMRRKMCEPVRVRAGKRKSQSHKAGKTAVRAAGSARVPAAARSAVARTCVVSSGGASTVVCGEGACACGARRCVGPSGEGSVDPRGGTWLVRKLVRSGRGRARGCDRCPGAPGTGHGAWPCGTGEWHGSRLGWGSHTQLCENRRPAIRDGDRGGERVANMTLASSEIREA